MAGRLGWAIALVLGVGILVWLLRSVGWEEIADAARRLGPGGFLLVCLASILLFALLGAAWSTAAGESVRRLPLFTMARMMREAASDFLPLSQLGGLAVGARMLRVGGVPSPRVYASMIVDQATEMASQLVFTLAGVAAAVLLLAGPEHDALRRTVIGGAVALAGLLVAFLFGQQRFLRIAAGLARRVLPGLSAALGDIEAELARLYLKRLRIFASFAWNLLAWLAMAAVAWLVVRLIGQPLAFWRLVSIESVIAVVRSVGFLVPGAIGLQEAAYALIGPLFGLPAGAGIALSLIKRARDAALALVSFACWHAIELRTALAARRIAAGG